MMASVAEHCRSLRRSRGRCAWSPLPSVGLAWAKIVSGDVAVGERQKADGEVAARIGREAGAGRPARTNCRGRAMLSARDSAVRLLMVNWRVRSRLPMVIGPYSAWLGMIWRPASSSV